MSENRRKDFQYRTSMLLKCDVAPKMTTDDTILCLVFLEHALRRPFPAESKDETKVGLVGCATVKMLRREACCAARALRSALRNGECPAPSPPVLGSVEADFSDRGDLLCSKTSLFGNAVSAPSQIRISQPCSTHRLS